MKAGFEEKSQEGQILQIRKGGVRPGLKAWSCLVWRGSLASRHLSAGSSLRQGRGSFLSRAPALPKPEESAGDGWEVGAGK